MQTQQIDTTGDGNHFHPSDILVKTSKGNRESRTQTADSNLPRRLRTLLMVVDGKTPFHIYEGTLENYGDVASLYAALETDGYITRIRRNGAVAANAEIAEPATPAPIRQQGTEQPLSRPRPVARHDLDDHSFRELVTEVRTVIEDKLGRVASGILPKIEQAQSPQALLDLLPELAADLDPHFGERNSKKFVCAIRRKLA